MEQALRDAGGETAHPGTERLRPHLEANLACGDPDGPWAGRVIEWIRGH